MKVVFSIFGLPVHFLGLMVALGFVAAIIVAYIEVKRKGLNPEKLFDLALYCIMAGVVGARLFYILFYNLSYYLENPLEIFKITEGGLSIHGGLVAAIAVGYAYIRKNKLNFFEYADAIAPGIILAQGIGRVGCDVFGKIMKTPLFWGVNINGQILHPAQIYEFLLDYLVFFILWRKRKHIKYNGQIFIWYIILFAINRGVVELFRINPVVFGWFTVSHLLSVIFIAGALMLMYLMKKGVLGPIAVEQEQTDNIVEEKTAPDVLKDIAIVLAIAAVSLFIYYSAWK